MAKRHDGLGLKDALLGMLAFSGAGFGKALGSIGLGTRLIQSGVRGFRKDDEGEQDGDRQSQGNLQSFSELPKTIAEVNSQLDTFGKRLDQASDTLKRLSRIGHDLAVAFERLAKKRYDETRDAREEAKHRGRPGVPATRPEPERGGGLVQAASMQGGLGGQAAPDVQSGDQGLPGQAGGQAALLGEMVQIAKQRFISVAIANTLPELTVAKEMFDVGASIAKGAVQIAASVARIVGGIALVVKGVLELPGALREFGSGIVSAQRHLSEYSGVIGVATARLEVGRMQRDVQRAGMTAGTFQGLTESQTRFERAILPLEAAATNIKNTIVGKIEDIGSSALEYLSEIPALKDALHAINGEQRNELPVLNRIAIHVADKIKPARKLPPLDDGKDAARAK